MKVGDNTNFGVITEIKEYSVCCGKNSKGVDTWIKKSSIVLIGTSQSTTKKIKQSLLRLYLSDTNKTIKSEKIIDYVKQEIGTEYIFGDTILRALRQLRQDGKLDYEIDGAKQDRNYKFKSV